LRRLILRPGAIGDFLLSLPAMERLRAEYTEVWAASRNLPLARFADKTRSIASTGLDLLGIPEVAPPERLLEELSSFDSIVSWYGANRREFREAVESLGLPFRFLQAVPQEGSRLHAADFYLKQVSGDSGAIPRLECPAGGGGFAAIHPFSGSPKKNWPLERYKKLAHLLEQKLPVKWIVERGTPGVEGIDPAPPIDDLYELACFLAKARLYVGNDSGVTHLAAAAGAPVVALFGPTDPAVWGPRGPRVRVISTPRVGQPMDAIPFTEVAAAALEEC
jgi:ADP-heptose:LPS heptosyltransferase